MAKYEAKEAYARTDEIGRLLRCITMAMGCLNCHSKNADEKLAWYRLLDAFEGQEPRDTLE